MESGSASAAISGGEGVIDLLQKYAPGRAITPDTTLDEFGLSSLDRVELMMDLEQQLEPASTSPS